jgi:hypothetical protein
MRERRMGKGASRGEESVLADSGREGEIVCRGRAGEKSDLFSNLLLQPALGFGRRRRSERIVGPGVFGIAAAEFFFHFEISRLPEAGEILRDLDGPACR